MSTRKSYPSDLTDAGACVASSGGGAGAEVGARPACAPATMLLTTPALAPTTLVTNGKLTGGKSKCPGSRSPPQESCHPRGSFCSSRSLPVRRPSAQEGLQGRAPQRFAQRLVFLQGLRHPGRLLLLPEQPVHQPFRLRAQGLDLAPGPVPYPQRLGVPQADCVVAGAGN